MASGTLSSASLDRYSSVALAGVATEYVRFGQAEGGLNDIQQLDGLLRALQVCCGCFVILWGWAHCAMDCSYVLGALDVAPGGASTSSSSALAAG